MRLSPVLSPSVATMRFHTNDTYSVCLTYIFLKALVCEFQCHLMARKHIANNNNKTPFSVKSTQSPLTCFMLHAGLWKHLLQFCRTRCPRYPECNTTMISIACGPKPEGFFFSRRWSKSNLLVCFSPIQPHTNPQKSCWELQFLNVSPSWRSSGSAPGQRPAVPPRTRPSPAEAPPTSADSSPNCRKKKGKKEEKINLWAVKNKLPGRSRII